MIEYEILAHVWRAGINVGRYHERPFNVSFKLLAEDDNQAKDIAEDALYIAFPQCHSVVDLVI